MSGGAERTPFSSRSSTLAQIMRKGPLAVRAAGDAAAALEGKSLTMNPANYYITINPVGLTGNARSKYVRDVTEHLTWIYKTTSGRILLNCIRRPSFPIEIRPHAAGVCNAVGFHEQKTPGAPLTGYVTYSPFEFSQAGSCATAHGANRNGRLWDEVLFHELVHVFRAATGKFSRARTLSWGMQHYTDNEEFVAVLCSNIYISDRTNKIKTGLRAGHKGFGAMAAEDAARFGLFMSSEAAFGLVQGFCNDNPIFTKALSDKLGDVVYNPIADYYRFPKLCEMFSIFGRLKDRMKFRNDLIGLGLSPAFVDKVMSW
jgi:hypothetical protein